MSPFSTVGEPEPSSLAQASGWRTNDAMALANSVFGEKRCLWLFSSVN
jgi:hypothetical protein